MCRHVSISGDAGRNGLTVLEYRHVCSSGAKPELSTHHTAARKLPRGWQGKEPHACQPYPLARGEGSSAPGGAWWQAFLVCSRRSLRDLPLPSPWTRGGGAWNAAKLGAGFVDRPKTFPHAGAGGCDDRIPGDCARVQARDCARCTQRPRALPSARSWGFPPATSTTATRRWTGW